MSVDPRKIDELFDDPPRTNLPGYAVGVMQDGEIVHAKGYGMADLEQRGEITSDTVFHVASLSKQFTAAAVLMLEADRVLSLDDLVKDRVDGMPKCAGGIRLRHLLHHTSGLRDQWPLLRLSGWRDMDEKTEDDVLDLVRRQRQLNFEPGDNFVYCNTGYTLLAHVVKKFSGKSLRAFTKDRIFDPLGMTATHFRDDHRELLPGRAYGYTDLGQDKFGFWVPNFDLVGPTSLHTTVKDLLLWAGNLLAPRGDFVPVVEKMLRPGKLNDGRKLGYGAGVGLAKDRGLDLVRHSGWDLGYVSHLAVYPKNRCAVAILGNLFTLAPAQKARQVAELCLGGLFRKAATPVPVREDQLAKRTGVYRHPLTGRVLWLRLLTGGLLLSYSSPPRPPSVLSTGLRLDPLDSTRFLGADGTTEVKFSGSRVTVRDEFGVEESFDPADPADLKPRDLEAYVGTYRSSELDTTLTVSVNPGDGLVVTQHRGPQRPLSQAYKDAFTDDDKGTYIFARNSARKVNGLTLSFQRVQNLRFMR